MMHCDVFLPTLFRASKLPAHRTKGDKVITPWLLSMYLDEAVWRWRATLSPVYIPQFINYTREAVLEERKCIHTEIIEGNYDLDVYVSSWLVGQTPRLLFKLPFMYQNTWCIILYLPNKVVTITFPCLHDLLQVFLNVLWHCCHDKHF